MKKNLDYILLALLTFFLFCGIITIVRAEDKAADIVEETIESAETEELLVEMEQVEQSKKLYSDEYKKRGALVIILSSLGIIVEAIGMKKQRKNGGRNQMLS